MREFMGSEKGLIILALIYGFTNTIDKYLDGLPIFFLALFFVGSALVGTLILMGIISLILLIIRKMHLRITVTNWVLLASICINIMTAIMRMSGGLGAI